MVLQGFFIRAGVDSTLIEAQFNYTNRANSFQHIGGAQGLWTFLDVPSVQAYLPSTYQVDPPLPLTDQCEHLVEGRQSFRGAADIDHMLVRH